MNNSTLSLENLCRKQIPSRSKFNSIESHKCHLPKGHPGSCQEFPFLAHLKKEFPRVAQKIIRDSIMTTGAAWKSEEAGPNRILRWVMLLSDAKLLDFGIDMSKLKPQVVSKLREKAADYDSCVKVAMWLTFICYQMNGAPVPPAPIAKYLEYFFGAFVPESTVCTICRLPLEFDAFSLAQRGKAEIETCHKDPRFHDPANVGFAHRECNIAQGNKTLDDFYAWIEGIIQRVR